MEASELVAIIRDLTIILFLLFGALLMIVASIFGVLLYRKVSPTLDAAKATMKNTQNTTSQLSDKLVKPLIAASTMSYSVGRIVAFILGVSSSKGGQNNG